MRRAVISYHIFRLSFVIFKKWQNLSVEGFRRYLSDCRKIYVPLSNEDMHFFCPWIARIARFFFQKNSCLVAASVAFVVAPAPVKLCFGVNNNTLFFSHAWAEWSDGTMQLDSTTNYEKIWEITS